MNSNDNKTPLEYYERAIQELINTREQLQTELESLKALKDELKSTQNELATTKAELKKEMQATNADLQKQKEKLYRIESGIFEGSVNKTKGWKGTLSDAKGDNRFIRQYIEFKKAFNNPPKVVVGISYANVSREATHRLKVKAVDIDCKGFFLEIQTWGNTEVFGCDVNWLAYGL
ncbi:MAG: H-type lectin domain-containing protein [Limnoraphis robusta]|uniref:H-type lectin domain-containing protein n=1 Tax=Limnoraphis robusta CCNP1315 TaxID=3110306 RepID=A0ABU5U640_9CYAN|nr:H-type lectin domain-containing protein [Limnoraphis robusta]MEA5498811.1 H-type lectin domain-containing protein [Limnoraphis robusta BA-68 BA1]MEA5522662.1 H-type lectin domain-containing protein [Limnoraphis robusta CCNP1315]MEA5546573.1 H-type lectin domain-containing protein [Limnoraphis robusta CCNP1324]